MITLTYWQFAMVFVWPVWVYGIYRLLRLGGASADNWRWALDKASDQRSAILEAFRTGVLPNVLFTKYVVDEIWPSYGDHYEALKKGEDVALLYPEPIRDVVQLICYGYSLFDFWKFMQAAEPKAFNRWVKAHATLTRMKVK